MTKKIFILGANGFIGNTLIQRILETTDWSISGIDLSSDRIDKFLNHSRFHFKKEDMTQCSEWIEEQIQNCDVVLPLAAIAIPSVYVKDPLRIFHLDFIANLEIIKLCVKHKKRVVFPSTSEVYGMCEDAEFDEETSNFILGPIQKERWIYSCSKQMLDRVIYAYGKHEDLQFTLFRPFNWIGSTQDSIYNTQEGSSRVVTQFISNILHGKNIQLTNGGSQKRCFTDIDDGISALMKIIENPQNCADGKIFNIGNPQNNISIKTLAQTLLELAHHYEELKEKASQCQIVNVDSDQYYGSNYQDTQHRVPSIKNAEKILHWIPKIDYKRSLSKILSAYFNRIGESVLT